MLLIQHEQGTGPGEVSGRLVVNGQVNRLSNISPNYCTRPDQPLNQWLQMINDKCIIKEKSNRLLIMAINDYD